ncbi:TetR/AcrR family transcriptional regulator [Microbacterium sp. RG1]|uniref:TetR/AcrR family transcriptional regulator n=1 Tax=Microbacterium sp. RG1 TaxID=2489212 RepID=UPI0013761676|nr:TetR family transcriptional regulator [Microbacterium sp. RG1]
MPRPPRRDAQQNMTRLREAALRIFMAQGIDAPLEDVARAAGVSIGTLYNHFGNRQRLLDEVLPQAALAQLARIQTSVAAEKDPHARLVRYIEEVATIQATDRLLSDALARLPSLPDDAAHACSEVMELGQRLVAEARRSIPSVFLDENSLAALVLANSTVQRSGPPAGWDELVIALARAHR